MNDLLDRISFKIYQNQETTFQYSQDLLIFFGLQDKTYIIINNVEHELLPAGLLVINPFELYAIKCNANSKIICLSISRALQQIANCQEKRFSCYIRKEQKDSLEYKKIRSLYANIFQAFLQDEKQNMSMIISDTLNLLKLLNDNFLIAEEERCHQENHLVANRLQHIVEFIHKHYQDDIALSDIAKQEFLSISYLSRFFRKYLHMTFSQYVKILRLRHATKLLIEENYSITMVASKSGFSDSSSFIEVFKQKYKQTPLQFRKIERNKLKGLDEKTKIKDLREGIDVLLSYATALKSIKKEKQTKAFTIDCAGKGIMLKHRWKELLNVGYAKDILLAPIQEQIKQAQKEIGFKYIRFHGVFDEDMYLYKEDECGKLSINCTYAFMVLDFILSVNLLPYIELSFMPKSLAKQQNKIFDRNSIISGCNDLTKWTTLVQSFIKMLINRYGADEIKKWRFTPISINYVYLGMMSSKDYQNLYLATYKAIKEINSDFIFGGPGCFSELIMDKKYIDKFLSFIEENKCKPDFISMQIYPHQHMTQDPLFMDFTISQISSPALISQNDSFMSNVLDKLAEILNDNNLNNLDIIVEECNSTIWQRDLSSDTCYKAVWILKNFCENYDRVTLGYWLLSDFIEERVPLESVFHGGYGLFTYNGIPKSGYQAMQLLNLLGKEKISRQDNFLLTKQNDDYQLLVYNYCHYSNLHRYKQIKKPEEAYIVFKAGKINRYQFYLKNIKQGTYRIERYRISRDENSAFDRWIKMNSPKYLTPFELQYLISCTKFDYKIEITSFDNNEAHIECVLNPLEAEIILLNKI